VSVNVSAPEPRVRPGSVLVVDDSAYARLRLRRFLSEYGCARVIEAADGDEALAAYDRERPDLVISDHVMRGKDGIEVARLLRERDGSARIVMLTVISDHEVHARALRAGVLKVLVKGDFDGLSQLLRQELAHA